MSPAAVLATTVFGLNWYLLLLVIMGVLVLGAALVALTGGGKLAAKGRRRE